jgi:LuxR family maltose regulon positive regulatory protein
LTEIIASPLLETKLYVPRLRRGLVARPRLSERLSRGVESTLTLISAPAGFGKSTLLAEWLASAPSGARSTAWLSLDPADNQPQVFWSYLIRAVRTAIPDAGATPLALLRESSPPPIETILATLLNELGTFRADLVLVLDDFHVVDAHEVQDGMAYLLEHLPPQVHVVIATRADPALPLARLRGRGELVEIRAADLRFTPDEAAAYLNDFMGLDLAARDIEALEARTEGWIAALQLAALSIRGRDDVAGFIASFTGDDRYIVDYLIEEVLIRQPDDVRSFLLRTSILSRLSGPLCDAVTGRDGGRVMLETLDRGNLFLVPLDDRRQWYRYHHLFADVLRARLLDEQPDRVPELHRRASAWWEQEGERAEAIRHALAAGDDERAADLVELAIPGMRQARQEATVLGWLRALPDPVVRRRPLLSGAYAWVLISIGELADVERHLQDAERWIGAAEGSPNASRPEPGGMVVVDDGAFRSLPAVIALYRAVLAQFRGDVAATVRYAREVLEVAPEVDLAPGDGDLLRGGAEALLGLAAWERGDLEAAHRIYAAGMARVQRAGNLSDAIGSAITLADIRITQGRLRDAAKTYEQALQLSMAHGEPVVRPTADMYVGLADIAREQGDLPAAIRHLQTSTDLGEHLGFPQNRHRRHVVMARIREAEGDFDGALDALHEARRLYLPDFNPDVQPLAAREARLWIRQGRLAEAAAWVRERDLSPDDELAYMREFEHITLARLLRARSVLERGRDTARETTDLLGRLRLAAEAGGRTGSLIEILVLEALAHQGHGDSRSSQVALDRALTLAEPEGYVRMFADEGLPAAFGPSTGQMPNQQGLIEPLSERELEVLRLLASDLDGPDIARELVVSLNTVRTHTKNIYAKLGVHDRRAAVRRAAELGLSSRDRDG